MVGQAPTLVDPTTAEQIDSKLSALSSKKGAWAKAPIQERIKILKEIRSRLTDHGVEWAKATASIRKNESAVSDALLGNVLITCTHIDGLLKSLAHFEKHNEFPEVPSRKTSDGQTVFSVFPRSFGDKISMLGSVGMSIETYIKPGAEGTQGKFYREPHDGKVTVVLGAGNQGFLSITDVLQAAFEEGAVVALKHHPIQKPNVPYMDYIFEPLSNRGYYTSCVIDDIQTVQKLLYHPLVDMVHMTGGIKTHDAIVWGPQSDRGTEKRRKANTPLLKVPITSELGCVTPWIVVPGPWSDEEIVHHARALTEAVASNVSCNCLSPKVVLLSSTWDKSDEFIKEAKKELQEYPLLPPYYPGIRERYEEFKESYPETSVQLGQAPPEDHQPCGEPLPWLVNEIGFPLNPATEYAFQVEPFAPVVTFVKVPSHGINDGVSDFLASSVAIANQHLWGTLSCTVLIHPDTEKEYPDVVQKALDDLEYGCIAVNVWSAVGYFPAEAHWGAFAGDQTLQDVGSGIGAVRNCLMFDHSQKSVVRTPFTNGVQPMPPTVKSPMNLTMTRALVGFVHSGLFGAIKGLF